MPTEPEQGILQFSWQEYFDLIKILAHKIKESHFPVTQFIGLTSGGIIPTLALGNMFGLRPAFLAVASYIPQISSTPTVVELPSGQFCLKRELATTQPEIGRQVVIIDDLTDQGKTLKISAGYITHRHPKVNTVKTGTLWHKSRSIFIPDWYALQVEVDKNSKPYIVQPYEADFTPAVLKQNVKFHSLDFKNETIVRNWEEYLDDIKLLAHLIIQKKLPVNQIIALTMGGLIPGLAISRILGLKPAILAVKNNPDTPENITLARDLITTTPFFGEHVLVIDDQSLTPTTIEHSTRWLKDEYGYQISSLFTAVLYHGHQGYPVDLTVHEIPKFSSDKTPKIIQPMTTEFPPFH